ncbi:DNA-binding response regulator [Streptomyces sp. NPDC020755]|uniref:helix-turn-helix transcriptional regulator n=1 Tax=Streptomyces sp. NPDC020755 TaxID=3154790 RepID=UPI0033F4286C
MGENEMSVFGVPEAEEEIYRHFLRNPGTRADDLHLLSHSRPREARARIARLQELGLLRAEDAERRIFPTDPEVALARLVDIRLHTLHQELQRVTRSRHVIAGLRAEQGARTPPPDITGGGLLAHRSGLVSSIVSLCERIWDQADELSRAGGGTESGEGDAAPRPSGIERRVLVSMCTVGKDEAGARELGVSVRTYRRHVADLMQTLGAASRAQAALLARERGWI